MYPNEEARPSYGDVNTSLTKRSLELLAGWLPQVEEITVAAVGGSTHNHQPVDYSDSDEAAETVETLEDAEGLGWASLGSWTDIAIRSSGQDILKQTIGALEVAVDAEDAELKRVRREKRIQLWILLIAALVLAALLSALLTDSLSGNSKSASWAVLATSIGTLGFSVGSLITSVRVVRQSQRQSALYKAALRHEADHRQKITAEDQRA
jgi:Ca2+/Na+ antiporter